MSNTDINTTSIMLYTAKTGSSTFIWISNAGDLIGGPVGRTTSPIGLVGESLDATIKGTEAYNSNDPWREFFSYAGGVFGTGVGIALIPTTSGAGLIIGGAIGSPLGPEGTFIGGIIGGVIFGATGVYIAEELGSKAMEELYDYLMGLPPSDNLTDAQRAELAAMLTAGGMPWDYNPNGEEANPSDFLGDLGKELGKLLDMLPDDLVPDFIDGLLGGLDDIFPNGLLPYLFNLFPVDLDPLINVPWKEAMYLDFWISPLALDLDGDGVETFGITSDKQVLFDHDGDGVRNGTGWVKSDDGLLVLDRNGNGTIDNGGELFGVYTKVNGANAQNGFEALKAEDTNKDGKFDANDTNFSNVRVWRDMDSDVLLLVA